MVIVPLRLVNRIVKPKPSRLLIVLYCLPLSPHSSCSSPLGPTSAD